MPGEPEPRTSSNGKLRVLIIEDHDDTRELYVWSMMAAGWHVEAAADGGEALLLAPTFDPDVIVVDLNLPVVGGVQVMQAMRSNARLRQVPMVACTAHRHILTEKEACAAGFDALVTKPCDPEALRKTVEELAGSLAES
jgi:two-component system alkaline phosphatase synthesis response regulator PhoP